MAQSTREDLTTRVRSALRDESVPLWFPELTPEIADVGWRKLAQNPGLTPGGYGTARMLLQDAAAPRRVVASLANGLSTLSQTDAIPVELLPHDLARQCWGPDLHFFQAADLQGVLVTGVVQEALEILSAAPTLLRTVSIMVKALHLVDPPEDNVDISFSDPALPFSAFVSVPVRATSGALRVAEALVHEAMHLQLTLIEEVTPLAGPSGNDFFSPWRNEYRTAIGVLHALYVFKVIHAFLDEASLRSPLAFERYAPKRRAEISRQVDQVASFRDCADLTTDGVAFVGRLLG